MKRRDTIRDLYASRPYEPEKLAMANSVAVATLHPNERVLAGPVRSMGLALEKLEQESRTIQDALAQGTAIIEIDPDLIDVSFVRDRLDGSEVEFDAFKASIEASGQEVPILLRPHPEHSNRYQVAYGHRRLRAIAQLGRKVRAVVRSMTDAELVVAQGIENSARKDLSYIEKAVFARRLEDRGFDRVVIMDALSTDKGELSKLISVARAVPEEIVQAIGPAPKAGRRRWLALADLLGRCGSVKAIESMVANSDFTAAETDARFTRVLAAAMPRATADSKPSVWKSGGGQAVAKVSRTGKTVTVLIDREPEFGEFVAHQLDELYRQFRLRTAEAAEDQS